MTLKVGEDEHAARVEVIGEGHVVLGLARAPDAPLVAGAEGTIESTDARGLHRVSGVLDWANAAAGDPRADVAVTRALLETAPLPPGAVQPALRLLRAD